MQTAVIAFDSKQLNFILTKMLGCFGFEVICAKNTASLNSVLKEQSPALLLTDWYFAQENMFDFLSQQENLPKTIFISNEGHPEQIKKILQIGIDEYIIKPFDNDILQSKLSMIGLL